MTTEKAQQWATWWARLADANRDSARDYLTTAQRRTVIQDAQFMAAYWAKRAQEVGE